MSGVVEEITESVIPGDRWMGLVMSRSMVCRSLSRYGVLDDFNKITRLRFGRMGRSGQRRKSLALVPRTDEKVGKGDGGLVGTTTRGHR